MLGHLLRLSATASIFSLLGTAIASAGPLTASRALTSVSAFANSSGNDTGVIAGDSSGTSSSAIAIGGDQASAQSYVLDATLHSLLTASSSTAIGAFANESATFYDTFTALSDTLADGTSVSFAVSIVPHYEFTTGGANGSTATAVFQNQVNVAFPDPNGEGTVGNLGQIFYSDAVGVPSFFPFSSQTSVIINVPIGQAFRITESLFSSVNATGGGSATVDALNTVLLFVDPLGAYTYSTSSGNNYQSAAVPEPSTLSMFMVAGYALIWYRRRLAVGSN